MMGDDQGLQRTTSVSWTAEVSKLFRLASLAAEFSDKLVEISCVSN
ncbi:hypothetical protein IMAU60055_00681 [Lactiplantibacillus plantarum]|nr:hypothetical protein [Lactiplantibacillus plantarum]